MKISITRSSILTGLVVIALVAALPFAIWEFIHTGELYILTHRFSDDIVARLHGPGRLRFILQPLVAIALGARDGIKDARTGKPPFLRHLIFRSAERPRLMRSALASVRDLLAIAILLDVLSQLLIFRMVHPGAALLIGPVLIAFPYAASRALANRASTWRSPHASAEIGALKNSVKKGLLMLAPAIVGAALASPAYSQIAGPATASEQTGTPELRVVVIVVPPAVIEQNGILTRFSVDTAREGKGFVKTVGTEFNVAPIAVMMQLDSPLRRKINVALITLCENGAYRPICDKWFGAPWNESR